MATAGRPQRVVFVTGHHFASKRKANFHWLAEAFWDAGWEVVFLTAWISWISWLVREPRFQYFRLRDRRRLVAVRERLWSYVWLTVWHPVFFPLRWLNRATIPLFRRYGRLPLGEIEEMLPGTDLLVFESTPGLLLFDALRALAPKARTVYRVSDPLHLVFVHPAVEEAEERLAPRFDLISTTSEYSLRQFAHLPTARLHGHGLKKEAFDRPRPNPYAPDSFNVLWVGNSHFDHRFLDLAAPQFPGWTFHVVGPLAGVAAQPNVKTYGELPFEETVAYLQHADVGLQTRSYMPGAEHLTDTLKVLQYTYCRLPIVAPEFLRTSRPNAFCYVPGDAGSIRSALDEASRFDRTRVDPASIPGWADIRDRILDGLPPDEADR